MEKQGNMRMQKGTWFMAPKLIYDMLDVSANARWVYGYLCHMADKNNASFPSYTKIAEVCGISRPTISRCLKELKAFSLLAVDERYGKDGRKTSNMYTILVPDTEPEITKVSSEELNFLDELKPMLEKYSYSVILDMLSNFAEHKKESSLEEQAEVENKKMHGHNKEVFLTDEEYINLIEDYGSEVVKDFIEQLDSRIASHGEQGKYKSHYATLRRWIERYIKEKQDKAAKEATDSKAAPAKRNRFSNFKGRERDYKEIERLEREHLMKSLEEDGKK
jgi:DNA invertase Pin-like site-specific DNA recombinase